MLPLILPPYVETIGGTSAPSDRPVLDCVKTKPGEGKSLSLSYQWEVHPYESAGAGADRINMLVDFTASLLAESRQLDPELARAINDEFWNLL